MSQEKVKIFASIIDDVTKNQIDTLASSEAYNDATIRVMPDCHAGMGCTIGSVIKYTDKVVPNTVGVDIGCGMMVVRIGKVDVDLKKLDEIVNENIPSGFHIRETPICKIDFSLYTPIDDMSYVMRSIGTLGGGNHFIELDVDEKNNKYLVIHTGSRNLGVQVCKYWQRVAMTKPTAMAEERSKRVNEIIEKCKAEGREQEIQTEINKVLKETAYCVSDGELAYLSGKDLEKYIHDMEMCQSYARLNRWHVAKVICDKMGWKTSYNFHTVHNYIDTVNKIIRKGAVSANKYEELIIPMNMRDGSLLCVGKGNEDWLYSAPHGAGRVMSRTKAKQTLVLTDFEDSMRNVYSTTVCQETIDEAPMVYKSIDTIIQDIKDTVRVKRIIKPLWNFKATTPDGAFLSK